VKRTAPSIIAALALLACSRKPHYTTVSYGQAQPLSARLDALDVFAATRPERPIKEIGEVSTTATNPDVAMRYILEGARSMGADGVILTGAAGVAESRSAFRWRAHKTREYGKKAVAFVYVNPADSLAHR
jgi:hypothetical protein